MITPNRTPWQPDEWQKVLRDAFRQPDSLLEYLGIPADTFNLDFQPDFALLVPEPFAARMVCGDPADPLLRQVLLACRNAKGFRALFRTHWARTAQP